jgi:hypothetical protein
MKYGIYLLMVFLMAASSRAQGEDYPMRSWTDSNGRQIEARYAPDLAEQADDDMVVLISKSGKRIEVKPERLSEADRAWLAGLREETLAPVRSNQLEAMSAPGLDKPASRPLPATAPESRSSSHELPATVSRDENVQRATWSGGSPPAPPPRRDAFDDEERQEMPRSLNPAFW